MKYYSVCLYLSLVLLYLVPGIPADIVLLDFRIYTVSCCVFVCVMCVFVGAFYFTRHSRTVGELQKRRGPNQRRTVSCGSILSAGKEKREVRHKFSCPCSTKIHHGIVTGL